MSTTSSSLGPALPLLPDGSCCERIYLDTPTPLGTYLGCGHKSINVATSEVLARTLLSKHVLRVEQVQKGPGNGGDPVESSNKKSKSVPQSFARGFEYEMSGFVDTCIERYLELADLNKDTLKHTLCPGLDDSTVTERLHHDR